MPTILESSHQEFRSFVVDATGQQHVLPVIVTEYGVLAHFARYMHLNHRKSRSWQESSVFAVRLLLEFMEAKCIHGLIPFRVLKVVLPVDEEEFRALNRTN